MSVGLWIVIWIGVLVAAILAEVISNAFVSIWFIAGALVLTAVNVIFYYIGVMPMMWYWQVLIFLVLSAILLFSFRPVVMKKVIRKDPRTNADRNVGEFGIVIKTIAPHANGLVKVSGQEWTAFSDSETELEAGSRVKVIGIHGVKLKVEQA